MIGFTDLQVKDELLGKKVRCKQCNEPVKVEQFDEPDTEDDEPDEEPLERPARSRKNKKSVRGSGVATPNEIRMEIRPVCRAGLRFHRRLHCGGKQSEFHQ
jgi:hypothetical protein